MAAAPEGVEPVLDFEAEEAQILKITEGLPLRLRVEDSGCVKELGKCGGALERILFRYSI